MKTILVALLLAGCAGSPDFRSGSARADLTPDHAVPLGGYGARQGKPMTGIHDRVFAKALWMETSERKICLVTTDLVGSLDDFRREIVKRLPPEAKCELILAASHNHSGPGALSKNPVLQMAIGKYDAKLYESYVRIVTDLVVAASKSARGAGLRIATGSAPDLQRNRRSKYYEKDPPLDPDVVVLKTRDAVFTNYAAHGTVLGAENFLLSGDWPGAFQRALERRMGGTALYTNGAEGDLSPHTPDGTDDFDRCEKMGEELAARVETWAAGREEPVRRLLYIEESAKLPSATLPFLPGKSVFGVLVINDAAFLCVPGEMTADLGLEIKRRYRERGFHPVAILGLANDHLGYFLTEEQYKKGGYEREVSLYGPGMGKFLIDTYDRLASRIPAK